MKKHKWYVLTPDGKKEIQPPHTRKNNFGAIEKAILEIAERKKAESRRKAKAKYN